MSAMFPADDSDATLLARRWFAAARAADQVRAECDTLVRVRDMADDAWRSARSRLVHLEAVCHALGEELTAGDDCSSRIGSADVLQTSAA